MICSFFLPDSFACSHLPAISSIREETKKKKNVHTRAFNLIGLLSTFYIYNSRGKKTTAVLLLTVCTIV